MSGSDIDYQTPDTSYASTSTSEESDCGMNDNKYPTKTTKQDNTRNGGPSGQKRRGNEDYQGGATKKVHFALEPQCQEEEDKSREPRPVSCVDTPYKKMWADYCNLPIFPGGGKLESKRRGYVVSLDDKMVYSGPFSEKECLFLSFKAHVLCSIMKDPHSPEFRVSGDVLMFPLCNPGILAKCDRNEVYEVFQATRLASQTKRVLGTQPVSVLEHCLLRYLLDIGDTGLSHMMLHDKKKTFINWHLSKSWGNTRLNCKDRFVQFFDNHMAAKNSLLVMRCMLLQHKASLLKFLEELNIPAIEVAAERYEISPSFVTDMKTRVNLVKSVLSDFQAKDLLMF